MNTIPLSHSAARTAQTLGARVFPVKVYTDPDDANKTVKQPLIKGWQNGAAAADAGSIARLFAAHPEATHAGIVTGGLIVIDLDGPAAQAWWTAHFPNMPATRTVQTRRPGGLHIYFHAPADFIVKNSAGKLAPGVDVRGHGGFVVDWSAEHPPAVEAVADAPAELLEFLASTQAQAAQAQKINGSPSASQSGKVGAGRRNTFLSSEAYRLRKQGLSTDGIVTILRTVNAERCDPPLDGAEIAKIARAKASIAPDAEPSTADWVPPEVQTYGAGFDPARIPPRRWLVGNRRSIGELTVDIGPPGTNKSMLELADAVAIATGRQTLNDAVHETGGVLFLVGEDGRRDFEARLAALLQHHAIPPSALGGRLRAVYLEEGSEGGYSLARMRRDVAELDRRLLGWLRDYPDTIAVFVDPMAAWHTLTENSNEAATVLLNALRRVAVQGQRHVSLNHHVTKLAMGSPEDHVHNLAAARGAGAIGANVRLAFTMARLAAKTAEGFGIAPNKRGLYRRLDPLKASYGPIDADLRLMRIETVRIANGEDVGVITEVNCEKLRAEAREQRETSEWTARNNAAATLRDAILAGGPLSANGAAQVLLDKVPEALSDAQGNVPALATVRQRLPKFIGEGLPTSVDGRAARIVYRRPRGKGQGKADRIEIAFDEVAAA